MDDVVSWDGDLNLPDCLRGLRGQQALVRALTRHVDEGICILNDARQIMFLNPAAEQLLGWTASELQGQCADAVMRGAATMRPGDVLAPGHVRRSEGFVTRKDGSCLPVACAAVPVLLDGQRLGEVWIFRDLRERRRAEEHERQAQARAERIDQLEHEIRILEQLSAPVTAVVTAKMLGVEPLREAVPDIFQGLVDQYEVLMEQALDQRHYKVTHNISQRLAALAERLGCLKARPRDLIDLHNAALKHKREQVSSLKLQAYLEEGRLMILELMGDLAAYYRQYFHGTVRPTGRIDAPPSREDAHD